MISFIVPVYYEKKNSYIVKRANKLIDLFTSKKDLELVIADSSKFNMLESKASNIIIKNIKSEDKIFSPAATRNKAVESSTKEYLFFFDVDLAFSENFFALLLDKLDKELIKNNKKFLMLPCLYLSKKGTAFFEHAESNQIALDHLRESFLLGENNLVERLAVNTSAILLKKEYFIEIGKFSENFFGHGGEDFELLHRLVANSPYALQNKDKYYIDKVEQFPANYTGFRQYMAYYSLPYLFSDLLIVHKWHERPLFNSFYMTRVNNENLLVKKMKEYDRHFSEIIWLSKQEPEEYSQFLKSLMLVNGFEDEKYVGLFKYKDGVKIRKRPISAKIRKLLTRPGMFFQDIKFIQLIKNWK